ncbi:hypothetical protein JF50_07765 [Pseudoalteromonas luteoviolacea]|uniref:Uncharacterized protein n=1 Tax=Pseudoalteromonas luteoviolacea TaxID=43657 RepID=A0A0C1MJI3_9GAMM|nr:hypothetical protein [Pseudoalteromonas luteoviolacea]KID57129.1 hypothetical protein JF50_07765 [Pseudoalteromonas luteoviolacea]
MVKVLATMISTIIVFAGCLGFAFDIEIGIDSDKAFYFLAVAIAIASTVGYQLICKDWGLKKAFVCLHVIPILLVVTLRLLN